MSAIQGAFRPSTVDRDNRTVEVTWTTGADVMRRGFEGPFYERLRVSEDAVDLTRLQSGAPLLDSHSAYSGVRNTLGVVEKAWIQDGEGRALVRFSARAEVAPVFQDVADGILRKVSVGYQPLQAEKVSERDGVPVHEVTRWEPHELSLVPIPADNGAQVRSAPQEERPMKNEATQEPAAETRNLPPPSPPPVDVAAVRREAMEAERTRVREIQALAARAKLPDLAADLVNTGASVDEARAKVLDALVERDAPEVRTQSIEVSGSEERTQAFRSAITEAMTVRALGGDPSEAAREFVGMPLLRVAEEVLQQRGDRVSFSSPRALAERAMATDDFSHIMADIASKSLRSGYEAAPQTFRELFRRSSASNFKAIERVQLSDAPDLELVAEAAPYTEGEFSDLKESYAVAKYGKIVGVTWESIINDDLDAISRFPQRLGASAAFRESDIVWGLLNANGVMADTIPVFDASRGNVTTDAFGVQAIQNARTAMRKQVTIKGRPMNLFPTHLIIGCDLENEAELLLQENTLIGAGRDEILPRRLRSLNLVVEPRIQGLDWYLATDTAQVDTMEYAYLSGEEGIRLTSEVPFNIDQISWKARMVFGAGIIDFRGLYKGNFPTGA